MKRKNVLLLINQLHGGGAEKVTANLSICLAQSYNVTLAVYNNLGQTPFEHGGELIGLRLPYSNNTQTNSFLKRAIRSLILIKKLRRLKKEKRVDVSISFLEASNIANILSRCGEKTILSVRSYLSNEFKDQKRLKIFSKVIRPLYHRADHIVTPAELIKIDLVHNFKLKSSKVSVIYNFTDEELVQNLKREIIPDHLARLFERFRVIINVGRITSPKGQWLLPPVINKVKKEIPAAKLVILGQGPLQERVLEEARRQGLSTYIEGTTPPGSMPEDFDIFLLGYIKNPFKFLSRSALFIKSSFYEGFPNVIIESMICGLPVISSDCLSGPREILAPKTDLSDSAGKAEYAEYGILIPAPATDKPANALFIDNAAAAIIDMLKNEDRYEHYRHQSLVRARDFDKKKIIEQWHLLIQI